MQFIISTHGKHWNRLEPQKKQRYAELAETRRTLQRAQIAEEIAETKQTLADLLESRALNKTCAAACGMLFSTAALDEDERATLEQIHEHDLFRGKNIEQQRVQGNHCAGRVSDEDYESAVNASQLTLEYHATCGNVLAKLCRARDQLQGVVLGALVDDVWEWFLFLGAILKPMAPFLLRLAYLDMGSSSHSRATRGEWGTHTRECYSFHWVFEGADVDNGSSLHGVAEDSLFLVPDCVCIRENIVVSYSTMTSVKHWLVEVAGKKRVGEGEQDKTSGQVAKKPKHAVTPAMSSLLSMQMPGTGVRKSKWSVETVEQQADVDEACVFSDSDAETSKPEDIKTLWKSLESERKELLVILDDIDKQYYIRVDGGEWQQRRTGRMTYGIRCTARPGSEVLEYCVRFHQRQSQAFEDNIYGGDVGKALAELWRRRTYHHAMHWVRSGKPASYPRESLEPFEIETSLAPRLEGLSGVSKRRLDTVLAMNP
eukprot:4319008-Amphidinium_carterae.3